VSGKKRRHRRSFVRGMDAVRQATRAISPDPEPRQQRKSTA
jgi:hypothetical protein